MATPLTDFARLYRDHAADVHRFALYLSGDPPLADDVVSEAFVRVWTARERVELTTVRGYLFAIVRNLSMPRTGSELRIGAVSCVEVGGGEGVDRALDALNDQVAEVRIGAASALRKLARTEGVPVLKTPVSDSALTEATRVAAAWELGLSGGKGVQSFLEEVASSDASARVRKRAREALKQTREW